MEISHLIDSELREAFLQLPPMLDGAITPIAARTLANELTKAALARQPKSNSVSIVDRLIPRSDGETALAVRIYRPLKADKTLPGVFYIHGGGFTVGNLDTGELNCRRLAEVIDCVVVAVDYRLAPENPFPAALEDCYSALKWMSGAALELGLDASRIAVRGGSAGGNLAAGLVLLARDRGEIKIAFQMLLCACLDDRHISKSSHEITDHRTWNRELSLNGWRAYLESQNRPNEVSPYAAPIRMENLSDLPPTYIMVGSLDLLRDENIDYAQRLMRSGVPTELHIYPGGFHGFETIAPQATISIRATAEYDESLRRALHSF